jgi:hypothetical protein
LQGTLAHESHFSRKFSQLRALTVLPEREVIRMGNGEGIATSGSSPARPGVDACPVDQRGDVFKKLLRVETMPEQWQDPGMTQ